MSFAICPNLMVSSIAQSVAFYTEVLEMELQFIISADKKQIPDPEKGVYAMLMKDNEVLMLQTRESLAEDLPVFSNDIEISSTSTLYFRGVQPDELYPKLDPSTIVKEPFTQWYGMREMYFRDPDGYILCAGSQPQPEEKS